jgi:hypothetical protein
VKADMAENVKVIDRGSYFVIMRETGGFVAWLFVLSIVIGKEWLYLASQDFWATFSLESYQD